MRYYTNGAGGNYNHHALLDDSTIARIIEINNSPDIYCSVQAYDTSGTEIASQLVFDVDNDSIPDAYAIARSIADDVMYEYETDTSIWFSGSKGFHVITGLVGTGSTANIAMKSIALNFSNEIDVSMYKSRSLFRLPNSINSKSGLRKIQVNHNETLQSVMDRAKTRQPYTATAICHSDLFTEQHEAEMERIANYKPEVVEIRDMDWVKTLPICIKRILHDGVKAGHRYAMCFYLVRHWRLCGVDVDEAIALASKMTVFLEAGGGTGYTSGMIMHYYSGMIRSVGCRSGELAEMMQAHCSIECKHADGWADDMVNNMIRRVDGFTEGTV